MGDFGILIIGVVDTFFAFFVVAPMMLQAASLFGVQKQFAQAMVQEGVVKQEDVDRIHPKKQIAGVVISLIMLAVLAFLKIGSQVYGNTPQGRIQKAKIALSLPLVGAINQMNGAAQFANTMSVLLAAGITINQAVDTTAKVMDNALLSEDVRSMREGIERGRSLVECLQGKKYFPPTMVDMCSVGEETGELEETLDNVADYYANEADYRIQRLLALLEPTMLVVLAIFAGIIVVSIYLPIFTMYDLM